MGNVWNPGGCSCRGGCNIANADMSSDSLATMGWEAEDGAALDVDNKVVLDPGEAIITIEELTNPGYSAFVLLDLTLGAASGGDNVRSITAGDITDFAGLRFEVVNDSDVVVAYAEMVTLKQLNVNGTVFDYSNTNSWDPFWSEDSPLVQQVFDVAKIEVCMTEQAIQFTTFFKYQSGYQWKDSSGAIHNNTDVTPAIGVTVSAPYAHSGTVRIRVKHNGSGDSMTFLQVSADKNYDKDTYEFEDNDGSYYYGCETETATYNTECDACQKVCAVLPGNRVHPFEVVSHPFGKALVAPTVVQYDNCEYIGSSTDYVPTWTFPTRFLADFTSDAVVNGGTGERISGTITESWTADDPASTVNNDIGFSLTARILSLTECGIVWRFTIVIEGCVYAALQATASASISTDKARGTKAYSGPTSYTSPAGPPPDLTGTLTVNITPPFTSDYETNATVTITADVEVPIWDECSPVIQIPLASGSPSLLVLFHSLTAVPKYTVNGNGDTLIEEATWTHTRSVIDLNGLFLEVRGC